MSSRQKQYTLSAQSLQESRRINTGFLACLLIFLHKISSKQATWVVPEEVLLMRFFAMHDDFSGTVMGLLQAGVWCIPTTGDRKSSVALHQGENDGGLRNAVDLESLLASPSSGESAVEILMLASLLPVMVCLRYLPQEVCSAHVTASYTIGQIRAPRYNP
jgi:hypothetical protein